MRIIEAEILGDDISSTISIHQTITAITRSSVWFKSASAAEIFLDQNST